MLRNFLCLNERLPCRYGVSRGVDWRHGACTDGAWRWLWSHHYLFLTTCHLPISAISSCHRTTLFVAVLERDCVMLCVLLLHREVFLLAVRSFFSLNFLSLCKMQCLNETGSDSSLRRVFSFFYHDISSLACVQYYIWLFFTEKYYGSQYRGKGARWVGEGGWVGGRPFHRGATPARGVVLGNFYMQNMTSRWWG